MKCSRCKQRCNIHWDGICDACKLNDTIQENKKLREALNGVINIYKVATSDGDAYSRASYVAKQALESTK